MYSSPARVHGLCAASGNVALRRLAGNAVPLVFRNRKRQPEHCIVLQSEQLTSFVPCSGSPRPIGLLSVIRGNTSGLSRKLNFSVSLYTPCICFLNLVGGNQPSVEVGELSPEVGEIDPQVVEIRSQVVEIELQVVEEPAQVVE